MTKQHRDVTNEYDSSVSWTWESKKDNILKQAKQDSSKISESFLQDWSHIAYKGFSEHKSNANHLSEMFMKLAFGAHL